MKYFSYTKYIIVAGILLGVTAIIAYSARQSEIQYRQKSIEYLETLRKSAHEAVVDIWLHDLTLDFKNKIGHPELLHQIETLLTVPPERDNLLSHPAQRKIRQYFTDYLKDHEALGIFVIDRNGISRASMRDANVGTLNLMYENNITKFSKVVDKGQPQFFPPFPSDVPLPNQNGILEDSFPTMFLLLPVINEKTEIVAAVSLRLDPLSSINRIIESFHHNNSGEVYAFNKHGQMITRSRFEKTLIKNGLLDENKISILNVRITDPGANLSDKGKTPRLSDQWPFTFMVQQALTGSTSNSSHAGYRDYRGVTVLGSWHWDSDIEMGFASEIDEADAMAPFYKMRRNLFFALAIILVLVSTLYMFLIRHKEILNKTLTDKVRETTSKLHREKENLRKSEKMYRSLMESSPDAILLVNEDGKIELANNSVEDIFGYKPDDIIGKKIELLVPDSASTTHKTHRDNYIIHSNMQHKVMSKRLQGQRKDGSTFPADINIRPIQLDNGTTIITDVRDKTDEENTHQQLLHSQKMEVIGQLTGGIAHDFNNILNSILGFSELALNNNSALQSESLKNYLEIIAKSGERARHLVKQMLAFSRGDHSSERQITDLSQSIKDAIQMLRPVIPSSIDIELNIEDATINILGDPVQINQVITNLIINARDAMYDKGKIEILLTGAKNIDTFCTSCHHRVTGDFVDLTIKDTGDGINKEHINKIFEPFFSTKEVGKGTGMGLSVVHGIIHNHDGHILAESCPGEGASFHLYFPIIADDKANTNDITDDADEFRQGSGEHILVVDDEDTVCLLLKEALTFSGYKISAFNDSTRALDFYNQNKENIDLVVTDQTMPTMTGYDMAMSMLEINNQLPVIISSGYSSLIDEEMSISSGLAAYLVKPVRISVLLETIGRVLKARKQAAAV